MKHKRHPEAQLEIADSPFPKPTSFCWPIDLRQWFFLLGFLPMPKLWGKSAFQNDSDDPPPHRSRPFALVHLGSGNTPNPRGLQNCSMASGRPLQASLSKNSQILFFHKHQPIINLWKVMKKLWTKCDMLSANPSTSRTSLLDRILGHHQCTPPLPCICRPVVHHSRLVGWYVLQEINCC